MIATTYYYNTTRIQIAATAATCTAVSLLLFAALTPAGCGQGIAASYSCPLEARSASDCRARCVMSGQRVRPQHRQPTQPTFRGRGLSDVLAARHPSVLPRNF